MRRLLSICCLAAAATGLAAERFEGEEQTLADLQLVSRHVVRGLERAGESAQASLTWSAGGFRAEFRANQPFDRRETREYEAAGWWTQPVAGGGLAIEAGVRWQVFTGAPAGSADRALEAAVRLDWKIREELRARVAYGRDIRLDADTAEAEVEWGLPLTRWGTYLETKGFAGWSDAADWRAGAPGPRVRDGYGYFGAEVRLPYRLGAHTTVGLGVRYSEAWNARSAGVIAGAKRRVNLAGSAGVSFDF